MDSKLLDLDRLARVIRDFTEEREWSQLHTPKNLAIALSVEASELLEPFQWLTAAESDRICDDPELCEHVAEEIADVLIYLVRLADVLEIDLERAVVDKLRINAGRYPVEEARGPTSRHRKH